jgi:DNA processing protein
VGSRRDAIYLLAAARNFNPAALGRIEAALGSLEALIDCPEQELKRVGLAGGMTARLLEVRAACDPAADLSQHAGQQITMVAWGEPEYPELLRELADAPLALFCKGDPRIMQGHGIAIVGSRKCSERGRDAAGQFGREIAELGIPVVSGMALGIDGAAHEGALNVNGPTVAVLGCGVDVVYPPRHQELYERLCAEGLVVSEYLPGSEPRKEHFPQRNRIISGLSKGCLVVEAPMGSGALITARTSIEQGREVFAVPGGLHNPHTRGNNALIKAGQAKLTESVDDILDESGESRADLLQPRLPLEQNEPPAAPARVSSEEQRLLELVSYEGSHVNDLVRKVGITTPECISHLTLLEIKGLISSASGGYYIRLK